MGVNIGGNQPNAGMPTGPSSEPPKHAADVDPNKLLLMLPDMDKRAREIGRLSKSVEDSHTQTMDDVQEKALIDFAKSLISEPDLPEGSKAALEKWISILTSDDAAQTGTGQPGADTPEGQATGQTAQQPGQTSGQSATATPKSAAIPFGGDPSELLTDNPNVTSAPVKNLGHLAAAIATAQGGQLTPEQATLLTEQANNLLGSPNLTDADTAMLQSFVGQLAEFPKTDDPKSTTKSLTNPQTAQTRSSKTPDTTPLAMNELGLSDEVQELGQKAMSFIQGNNGKVSEREAKQLEEAAEQLIAGGAEGDDLKALQNFVKALATFPRTATPGQAPAGSSAEDSPLLMSQPNINPRMAQLGQLATNMLKSQNNTLTQNEVEQLGNMAQELLSGDLSPEERMILQKWLGTLGSTKTQAPPEMNMFNNSMLFGATPARNPFMSPGIMTMLAPILAEILQTNNEIIKQSSKLKQNMMKLLVSMANEAFKFAIEAGQAKVAQLEKDAAMHMALGISQCLQAGVSIAMFGAQQKTQSKYSNEAKGAQMEKKMSAWADEGKTPKLKQDRQEMLKAAGFGEKPPTEVAKNLEGFNANKRMGKDGFSSKQSFGEKAEVASQSAQRMHTSGVMAMKEIVGQMGRSADSFIQSAFTSAKIQDAMREAAANAYKDMISQLMQLVTGSIQSATEEMQAAQRNFESFVQLYKDFANTITQGIYRSG